jgi:cystathionine beta-lyase/cystathionine gamma-synthase
LSWAAAHTSRLLCTSRTWPEQNRTATKWAAEGQTMRIHIGLEDPEDLIAGLEAGFARLNGT